MDPRTRKHRLMDFYDRIQRSDENTKIETEWGLAIQRDLVKVNAYCMGPETLGFGDGQTLLLVTLNIFNYSILLSLDDKHFNRLCV